MTSQARPTAPTATPRSPDSRLAGVLADLAAEGDALDALVADLAAPGWSTPTPAAGWDVAHQVAHLAWTDEVAVTAATDKAAWEAVVVGALEDPGGFVDAAAAHGAEADPADLLARWRASRAALAATLAALPEGERVPWFGPPMSATSMATARFMETWAHGLDVAEALGAPAAPTDRIRHVAHLGVRTRDFAFSVHRLTPPGGEFRVELVAPGGGTWAYGPEDAAQTVRGPAYDFCLLVTQRRNRADLDLVAAGPDADRWLDIAQAFAGPPGAGREPGRAPGGAGVGGPGAGTP
ncbi:TIGR03084 family protein [Nocardioides sp. WL0053]|uniref:TIGR03084 family protein n=1 Tax=Nocardioides jiangsuensis TaxID=2866161 RepID=A0ABS7RGA8_9ACTN|nr:TIGR03084 family metal-binding protein [Nocardioides jiangsuensis]MBY9074068.1 TIGR03084 family protein [Nocardioides jiangsuensis]